MTEDFDYTPANVEQVERSRDAARPVPTALREIAAALTRLAEAQERMAAAAQTREENVKAAMDLMRETMKRVMR